MVSLISVASMLCDSDDNDIDDATGGVGDDDDDYGKITTLISWALTIVILLAPIQGGCNAFQPLRH